jgi:predicted GIY-YIG superfamily endonuclease
MQEHQGGLVSETRTDLPVKLVSYFAFGSKAKAIAFEHYLKTDLGRAFANKYIHP